MFLQQNITHTGMWLRADLHEKSAEFTQINIKNKERLQLLHKVNSWLYVDLNSSLL